MNWTIWGSSSTRVEECFGGGYGLIFFIYNYTFIPNIDLASIVKSGNNIFFADNSTWSLPLGTATDATVRFLLVDVVLFREYKGS
jgi:hypothetical protein